MTTGRSPFERTGLSRAICIGFTAAGVLYVSIAQAPEQVSAFLVAVAASNLFTALTVAPVVNAHLGAATNARTEAQLLRRLRWSVIGSTLGAAGATQVGFAGSDSSRLEWLLLGAAVAFLRSTDLVRSEWTRLRRPIRASNRAAVGGSSFFFLVAVVAGTVPEDVFFLVTCSTAAFGGAALLARMGVPDSLAAGDATLRIRPYLAAAAVAAMAANLDMLLAPRLVGIESAPSYAIGYRIAALVSFPVLALALETTPKLSAQKSEGPTSGALAEIQRRLPGVLSRSLALAAVLSLVGVGFDFAVQPARNVTPVVAVLLLAHIFNVVMGPSISSLISLGDARGALASSTVGLALLSCWITVVAMFSPAPAAALAVGTALQLIGQNWVAFIRLRRLGVRVDFFHRTSASARLAEDRT